MNTLVKKIAIGISTVAIAAASYAMPALAAGNVTYTPWTFIGSSTDCGPTSPAGTPGGASATTSGNSLTLTKSDPTNYCSSAGATINNAPTTVTSLSFQYTGYCGAGSPRFNVYAGGTTYFFGCADGTISGNTVTFTAGNTYGGVVFPAGGITGVTGIDLVQDEMGSTTLSNIMVNGMTVSATTPTSKDQCKKGGYQNLTDANGQPFKNQGQCVSYFNHQS